MTTGLATMVLLFIFLLLCDALMYQMGRWFRRRRAGAKRT